MANVTRRGEWQVPSEETIGEGTILEVYGGKNKDEKIIYHLFLLRLVPSVSYLTIYIPNKILTIRFLIHIHS